MQIPSYSPLTLKSDLSISTMRKERAAETLKVAFSGKGYEGVSVLLNPDAHDYGDAYLTGFNLITVYQPPKLQESVEQKMQDKANTPNLHLLKEKQNHSFGGYETDKYGFMGGEFLKAANLPSDYKIHKNVLQAIYDVSTIPVARDNVDEVYASYHSIDLIAGISYAYKEIQNLTKGTFDSKESYSENEIKQMFKNVFWDFTFNTPLMQDYKNEKGAFKREGIVLAYAYMQDTFAKADSPFTKLTEYGKFVRGMPSSYTPNTQDVKKKPKTPEELKKEMLDKLNEVYLKILENTKETNNKDTLESINGFINEMIRQSSSKPNPSANILVVELEK